MEITNVYKCLCDTQRLRVLNLLREGPLCVCHLLEVLDADPVRLSKQLRYMKELGMVRATREANWIIYSLPDPLHPLVVENLKCLQDVAGEDLRFAKDLKARARILKRIARSGAACPQVVSDTAEDCGCESPEGKGAKPGRKSHSSEVV